MPRGNPHPHKYKHGKIDKAIDQEIFGKILERVVKVDRSGYSVDFVKALLILLYWTGLRIREIIGVKPNEFKWTTRKGVKFAEPYAGILKENIQFKDNYLFVWAKAFKHGRRKGPLAIPANLFGVKYIVEQWQKTGEGNRVFPVSYITWWRILKRIDPKLYSHFFRLNRITKFCENPKASIAKISSWSGTRPETVSEYLERSGRFSRELGDMMTEEQ